MSSKSSSDPPRDRVCFGDITLPWDTEPAWANSCPSESTQVQCWKPEVGTGTGQTPISERMGWDTSGKEQLLPAGQGHRGAGGLQGCPSKHHIPMLGCAVQVWGCAQWDITLHPEHPVALLELTRLCIARDPCTSADPARGPGAQTGGGCSVGGAGSEPCLV